jgi:hypothetical protein
VNVKASAGRPTVAPACADPAAGRGSALVRAVALAAWMAFGPAPAWGATAAPCCGPISADGRMLLRRLDESGVLQRWLPRSSIDWRTGEPVPRDARHPVLASHCSAFVAAISTRLGVPLLRPPAHGQLLLANAQAAWLSSTQGRRAGWREVDAARAQRLANQGWLVLGAYASPNPGRAGHIAVIRPATPTLGALEQHGPHETQAGAHNLLDATVARGFSQHRGAWRPGGGGGLRFYAHAVDWSHASR